MKIGAVIDLNLHFTENYSIRGVSILERMIISLRSCTYIDTIAIVYSGGYKIKTLSHLGAILMPGENREDVMKQLITVGHTYNLDSIVYLHGNAPFISPWLIDVGCDVSTQQKIDYLTTINFPNGQNIAIVSVESLKKIYPIAMADEKKYISLFYERNPQRCHCKILDIDLYVHNVDEIEDMEKIARYLDKN